MTLTVIDQMRERIVLSLRPQRIISLVPSQTELLFDLGLYEEIIGITRFCIHPSDLSVGKVRVGGTKNFNIDLIKSLNPDLIIGNKEENYEAGITELKQHFPVWMSDINTLSDSYQMMTALGEITNKPTQAEKLIHEIRSSFENLSTVISHPASLSCAYFIWRKPYMVAASGTFIDHMLGILGVRNVFADMSRYPEVSADQMAVLLPDLIFLSSEPYSFSERHMSEFKSICPKSKVLIVDGELFSWYGSRLRHTAAYFKELKQHLTVVK
jgi:ABC-type Fe3+-hydroxamate transport system substrate-binding protein